MTSNQNPPTETALAAVIAAKASVEQDDRPDGVVGNAHIVDDYSFRQYVADKDDLDGMIAYCFYKFQKIDYLEKNPLLTEEQIATACASFVTGRNYADNKEKARNKITALERMTIAAFARQKAKRDWFISLSSGIVAAVLAPFAYTLLVHLISSSGVMNGLH